MRPGWQEGTAAMTDERNCAGETPQPARTNSEGHLCLPWCTVDHCERIGSRGLRLSYHGTESPVIATPSGYVSAMAYQDGFSDDAPQVSLSCLTSAGSLLVDTGDSAELAALVEQLADATPDQHRELAAAIRQAAAIITAADPVD